MIVTKFYIPQDQCKNYTPLYGSSVSAGFPSPADDYIESELNLHEYLIKHPAATFFIRAEGYSMINAGISPGDLLVVDRSLDPSHGKIVIAMVENNFLVKKLHFKDGKCMLLSENPNYKPIIINEFDETIIWGVVTSIIKQLK
jgi:DNA polymerase V